MYSFLPPLLFSLLLLVDSVHRLLEEFKTVDVAQKPTVLEKLILALGEQHGMHYNHSRGKATLQSLPFALPFPHYFCSALMT